MQTSSGAGFHLFSSVLIDFSFRPRIFRPRLSGSYSVQTSSGAQPLLPCRLRASGSAREAQRAVDYGGRALMVVPLFLENHWKHEILLLFCVIGFLLAFPDLFCWNPPHVKPLHAPPSQGSGKLGDELNRGWQWPRVEAPTCETLTRLCEQPDCATVQF